VKFNVVLTLVEVTALTIVMGVGFYAIVAGDGDVSRITVFESPEGKGMFLAVTAATSIAFFAMVGFEDSVNMVEETREPEKIFPRTMLTGLGIAVIIYMLVAVAVVAVLTPSELREINEAEGRALLEVVSAGAPDFPIDRVFPFLACFAVANTSLINMMMASRLLYGLANQDVLPRSLGKVSPNSRAPWMGIIFSTLLALGLIYYVANRSDSDIVLNLSSTTALLLLCVFAVVNIACLVLRRDGREGFFRSPGPTPVVAALLCLYLAGPWVDRDGIVYQIAGGLLLIGIVLWVLTWLTNRGVRAKKTGFRDIEHMEDDVR
jgi:amino acid transporter